MGRPEGRPLRTTTTEGRPLRTARHSRGTTARYSRGTWGTAFRPNAFRKFGVYESYDLKPPRCVDRFGLQEPGPACHGLAHGPRARALPPWRDHAAADECAAPAHEPGLLLVRKDVVEGPEEQPHAADDIQHVT